MLDQMRRYERLATKVSLCTQMCTSLWYDKVRRGFFGASLLCKKYVSRSVSMYFLSNGTTDVLSFPANTWSMPSWSNSSKLKRSSMSFESRQSSSPWPKVAPTWRRKWRREMTLTDIEIGVSLLRSKQTVKRHNASGQYKWDTVGLKVISCMWSTLD